MTVTPSAKPVTSKVSSDESCRLSSSTLDTVAKKTPAVDLSRWLAFWGCPIGRGSAGFFWRFRFGQGEQTSQYVHCLGERVDTAAQRFKLTFDASSNRLRSSVFTDVTDGASRTMTHDSLGPSSSDSAASVDWSSSP